MKPLQKLATFLSSESLPTTSTTTCALCIHYDIHSVPSSSLPRRSYHTFIDPILLHEGIINFTRLPILDHIDNPFPVKPIETRALHVSMTHSEYNVPFLDSLRLHLLLIFIYLHQRHPDHGCYFCKDAKKVQFPALAVLQFFFPSYPGDDLGRLLIYEIIFLRIPSMLNSNHSLSTNQ